MQGMVVNLLVRKAARQVVAARIELQDSCPSFSWQRRVAEWVGQGGGFDSRRLLRGGFAGHARLEDGSSQCCTCCSRQSH